MKARQVLCFSLMLLPWLLLLWDVAEHGRNVPYWDQWTSSARVALQTQSGDLRPADLSAQHLEHRILWTNLGTAFFTRFNGWNIHTEMSLSLLLALANFGLVYALYRHEFEDPEGLMGILLAWLLFSIRQRENWLWSFQNQWFFMLFFLLLGLYWLQKRPVGWWAWWGCALAGAGGLFAFGAGVFILPILGVNLWLRGYRERPYVLAWLAWMALCFAAYFYGYDLPERADANWLRLPIYFFAYLGSPFVYRVPLLPMAVVLGLLGLGVGWGNARYLWRNGHQQIQIWVSLAAMGLGAGLLACVNRLPNGLETALTSRYVTLANLLWVSVFVLSFQVLQRLFAANLQNQHRPLVLLNFLLWGLVLGFYAQENYAVFQSPPLVSDASQDCLEAFPTTREAACLKQINLVFDPAYNRPDLQGPTIQTIDALAAAGLSTFHPEN